MRTLLFIISIFAFSSLLGQTSRNLGVFKTEDFTKVNSKTTSKTEKIIIDSTLDLKFFRKQFYIPYYFPEKLIDKSFKSQSVTVWSDAIAKRDYKTNWTHAFEYDDKSRVTVYGFSGCMVCSNLPYTIKLFYNENNEVIKMEKFYSLVILTGDNVTNKLSTLPQPVETFFFEYDTNSEIIKLNYFVDNILHKRISKI